MPAPRPRCTGGRGGQPPAAASANGLAVRTERGSCCFVNMGTGREHRLVRGERAEIKTWPEEADYSPLVRGTAEQSGERRDRLLRTRCRVAAWALTFRAVTSLKLARPAQPGASTGAGARRPQAPSCDAESGLPALPVRAPDGSPGESAGQSAVLEAPEVSASFRKRRGSRKEHWERHFRSDQVFQFSHAGAPRGRAEAAHPPPRSPLPWAMTGSCLPFP